ncbi:hypothetical protein P7K49_034021 [Saguinus oedipus]|uniref:Uncharacterized protein n=1 Tax=Saguinus oedipus TaxID=9490 RepID=A0ABQ9TTK1_SAGOE|nr:hypothetical protein P7K49_034021 [Saguinus oedipus]
MQGLREKQPKVSSLKLLSTWTQHPLVQPGEMSLGGTTLAEQNSVKQQDESDCDSSELGKLEVTYASYRMEGPPWPYSTHTQLAGPTQRLLSPSLGNVPYGMGTHTLDHSHGFSPWVPLATKAVEVENRP